MSKDLANWLNEAESQLRRNNVATAHLDALVLLCDELVKDKAWVLGHPEYILTSEQTIKLQKKIAQRSTDLPLAYIRGRTEFYGRDFIVNHHVLVPRPESEALIDILKTLPIDNSDHICIIDIGTGSGCLGITAKLELPTATVYGLDIDESCLVVAKKNARQLHALVTFLKGDLIKPLEKLPSDCTIIVLANLPYVPTSYPINKAATHEPIQAIFSGQDGLDHYRRLFTQLQHMPGKPAYVITESLLEQHTTLSAISQSSDYLLRREEGLAQLMSLKS